MGISPTRSPEDGGADGSVELFGDCDWSDEAHSRAALAHVTGIDGLPVYMFDKAKIPGIYIGIFHGGRMIDDPDDMDGGKIREELADWGFGGPLIGPLSWVHTTYAHHIKFEFVNRAAARPYEELLISNKWLMWSLDSLGEADGVPCDIQLFEDLILVGTAGYGDITVFYDKAEEATDGS